MVRVPGSLGDAGYHRESQDDAQMSNGSRDETPTETGSPTASLNARSTDRLSPGRSSADGIEDDLATDLEEKPRFPPKVPSGTPADPDASQDPPDEGSFARAKELSSTTTPAASGAASKKTKAARKKLKAPDSEGEDRTVSNSTWSRSKMEMAYLRTDLNNFLLEGPVMQVMQLNLPGSLTGPVQTPSSTANKLYAVMELLCMLEEAGVTAGAFDADDLFNLAIDEIRISTESLFNLLKPLVGECPAAKTPESTAVRIQLPKYNTGSSLFASATPEAGSNSSSGSRRMQLGPSCAAMFQTRSADDSNVKIHVPQLAKTTPDRIPLADPPSTSSLETYFQAAMSRFLNERPEIGASRPAVSRPDPGEQDIDMESAGSQDHPEHWEYDPDDIDMKNARRTATTAAAIAPIGSPAVQRVKISAISDLKEFTGKDHDEERARGWISKVKSAFTRDQATDEEKCLTFADLLTGPARNWYRQLSRSTRAKWSDLLRSFQTQYCGLGVSVTWQYYHARKRSEETPLDYLYRLNVAGMRARLKIKDGDTKVRIEHVEHFIETLDDPDLADQLSLLRLADAVQLEDVLRARERLRSRQKHWTGSSKYRPKSSGQSSPTFPTRTEIADARSECGSDAEDSRSEGELVRAYVTAASNRRQAPVAADPPRAPDPGRSNDALGDTYHQDHQPRFSRDDRQRCSVCGSHRHSDLGCWKRLTCQKCGKSGHPSDRCFFVCRGCGQLHDHGKCQMDVFYSLIRQWFDPSKHPGLLPEAAENMLN
ncbi:hypothetical protein PF001_g26516 [Phytophthora fragariae]|uniref:CCHC-type domain-containing protein n=1 Tax=Phytophthora fragariae TaxID=53985 RepID=A0A6A4BL19_9STRA|nr:hypothetical protein PF001_g26516 [Phytophthora fragariae]